MNIRKDLLSDLKVALRHLNTLNWRDRGFWMGRWADGGRPETPELGCGTTACAYGVGTTLPSWKAAGLKLQKITSETTSEISIYFRPIFDAKDKLGLTEEDWKFLFSPYTYISVAYDISPGQVANRIDDLLVFGHVWKRS